MKKFFICLMFALSIALTANANEPYNPETAKPNETGDVMVVMYHALLPYTPSENYLCSIWQFKNDMKKLYENGYRLTSLADVLDNNIRVEKGYTPVVLTFDDGYDTAFSLVESGGKLVPKKDCAVDIIEKFNEQHPDFGQAGVFFICGYEGREPFYGAGTLKDRLSYLVNAGYELGNHTTTHAQLNSLNKNGVMKEMAGVEKLVRAELPGYRMRSMAYPYGTRPNQTAKDAVLCGEYDGYAYDYDVALYTKIGKTSALPYVNNFDKLNYPRVRGSDNSTEDLGWFIKYYQKNPDKRFISDGDPDVITVPKDCVDKLNVWECLGKTVKVGD